MSVDTEKIKVDGVSAPEAAAMSQPPRSATSLPPSAAGMEAALESSLAQALGKSSGDFLGELLEHSNDPSLRDYGERYRYMGVIGEGAQGKVLSFRDDVLDREVAIKVVKAPFTTEREALLEHEAKYGGTLEHPNILPIYDLCHDETGSPFFVMKKVEGRTLEELLKKAHAEGGAIRSDRDRGEFSRRRLLNVFLQVCHAMEYAHSRGVYHLDLKPLNVKLGPFGEVYVFDWGLASRKADNRKKVGGTPLFIAPEFLKTGKPDARCDVYSLGVMLYRILVNQQPRDVGKITFKEYQERLSDFPIIPPRQRDPGIPRDLEAIVMTAMRENPDERYQSVRELADDLERFLDILPVSAYREGWTGRVLKFSRRHKATVLAGAVMLTALVLTGFASFRAKSLERQAIEAQVREEKEKRIREETSLRLAQAEEARMDALRRRAAARVPLEKGAVIMDNIKTAVEKETDNVKKFQMLKPAMDLFTEAVAVLEEGRPNNPDAAEAYYNRARAYDMGREIGRAMDDYQSAYQRDPSFIMAHYYLGRIYNDNHKYDQANAEFAAMRAIDPGNEFSELGQAYIDMNAGRNAEALERTLRIEEKDGESPRDYIQNTGLYEIWYIRGMAYSKRGEPFYDPRKAIDAYTQFCRYEPNKPSAYLNRGDLYLSLVGDQRAVSPGSVERPESFLDLAIADYTQALAIDPNYKWALKNRGYAVFKFKGDYAAGLKDIEAALAIDPEYVPAILDRAAIRESEKKYDLAAADYELVRKLNPNHLNLDYRIGMLQLMKGELPEAEASLDIAVAKAPDPNSEGVRLYRRGVVRFLRGHLRESVEDFDASLAKRNDGKAYPALMRWVALSLLGEAPDPAEFGRQIDIGPDKPWLAVVASFYLGDDPFGEEQAMLLAVTPEAKCETAFFLGAKAWLDGNLDAAMDLFKQSVDSDVHLYMEYSMSKILRERLLARQLAGRGLPDRVGGMIEHGERAEFPAPAVQAAGLPPTVPSMADLVETGR